MCVLILVTLVCLFAKNILRTWMRDSGVTFDRMVGANGFPGVHFWGNLLPNVLWGIKIKDLLDTVFQFKKIFCNETMQNPCVLKTHVVQQYTMLQKAPLSFPAFGWLWNTQKEWRFGFRQFVFVFGSPLPPTHPSLLRKRGGCCNWRELNCLSWFRLFVFICIQFVFVFGSPLYPTHFH